MAVLYAAGDDLPPVVGEVEWRAAMSRFRRAAPRAIHLQRFTVLQVQGLAEVSLRMTDGVAVAGWHVSAIPDVDFRSGDTEGGTEWSSGSEVTDLICVPVTDGAWAIRADITFADDGRQGTFYWRLNVSESTNG